MVRAPDSKEKTVVAAAKLFSQRGYHGTALNDILDAAGSPRGSLYFHFPGGKEEIGEVASGLAGEAVRKVITNAAETSNNVEDFLKHIVQTMASNLERSDYTEGCPIATTALETAAQSDVLGSAARNAFQSWEHELTRGLERFGLKRATLLATMVLSQIEGALLLARTYRSLEPLHRAQEAVKLLANVQRSKRVKA
jgi:TetR/AcrR family transcriptional regulator, lmrAB and yxaGH operons repressor